MFSLVAFAIIGVFVLVVLFTAWLCRTISIAMGAGRVAARIAAIFGASIILVPVFWDVPPTLIAHRYYCAADAGVWVYKTPQHWYAEKIGKEPKTATQLVETAEERLHYFKWEDRELLAQGLDLESQHIPVFLSVELKRWRIIDQSTFEVLAEHRDYSAFNKWGSYKRLIFARPFCTNGKNAVPNFAEVTEKFKRSAY